MIDHNHNYNNEYRPGFPQQPSIFHQWKPEPYTPKMILSTNELKNQRKLEEAKMKEMIPLISDALKWLRPFSSKSTISIICYIDLYYLLLILDQTFGTSFSTQRANDSTTTTNRSSSSPISSKGIQMSMVRSIRTRCSVPSVLLSLLRFCPSIQHTSIMRDISIISKWTTDLGACSALTYYQLNDLYYRGYDPCSISQMTYDGSWRCAQLSPVPSIFIN
jgi:hypothetical protein